MGDRGVQVVDKDKGGDVDEVAWLTLEGWGLEFGWRTRLLIWVTRQLYRLGLIEMEDVKAVVEGVVNDGKREFSDARLHNSGTCAWWSGDER